VSGGRVQNVERQKRAWEKRGGAVCQPKRGSPGSRLKGGGFRVVGVWGKGESRGDRKKRGREGLSSTELKTGSDSTKKAANLK